VPAPRRCDERAEAPARCQRATIDLVNVGDKVEAEKDALLERFFVFARHACAALRDQGHWADYIDPCSGLPVRSPPPHRRARAPARRSRGASGTRSL